MKRGRAKPKEVRRVESTKASKRYVEPEEETKATGNADQNCSKNSIYEKS
jgi:hypothetical protein